MKTTQTHADPKTDTENTLVRGVEAHKVGEAEQILKEFQRAVSQIPEVQQVVYKQYKKSIEFIVTVDRIRRELSGQLSKIEFRFYDEYTDWFFNFEHIGIRTFSEWPLDGYVNLFSRE